MVNRTKLLVLRIIIVLVVVLTAGTVFFVFDPAHDALFLRCPLHALTGWSCSFCGAQRALHALLHGQWAQAWAYNYCLPFIVFYFVLRLVAHWRTWHKLEAALSHKYTLFFLLLLVLAWTVLRNYWGL